MRFPQFFGIGAQKAGTTWLHRTLSRHPGAWLPPVKELHYFDRIDQSPGAQAAVAALNAKRTDAVLRTMDSTLKSAIANEAKIKRIHCLSVIGGGKLSDEWYARIFQFAPAVAVCGEITPEYALLPDTAFAHMVRLQPEAKFVFMMRDPIDRTWSALRMMEREGRLDGASLTEPLARPGFVAYSDYKATIDRLLLHAERRQLLTLYYDDLQREPRQVAETAFGFLGLDPQKGNFQDIEKAAHAGPDKDMAPSVYEALKASLKPIYERLLSLDSPIPALWYAKHFQ